MEPPHDAYYVNQTSLQGLVSINCHDNLKSFVKEIAIMDLNCLFKKIMDLNHLMSLITHSGTVEFYSTRA